MLHHLFDYGMIMLMLLFAIGFPLTARYGSWRLRFIATVASFFAIIGIGGFLGAGLSTSGALNFLPSTFEWPMGYARGIITLPDGRYAAPHWHSGRVQLYDSNWRFIRGWRVDAYGGMFTLRASEPDKLEVITARSQRLKIYTFDGQMISEVKLTHEQYASIKDSGMSHWIPTHWWLITFTSPFYSWFLGVIGMVTIGTLEYAGHRKLPVLRVKRKSIPFERMGR